MNLDAPEYIFMLCMRNVSENSQNNKLDWNVVDVLEI